MRRFLLPAALLAASCASPPASRAVTISFSGRVGDAPFACGMTYPNVGTTHTTLTALDFLGLGLPPGSASLGELLAQGKANLQAPWLGITAFLSIAVLLSLLIFIGEAVRDALDPRKIFK